MCLNAWLAVLLTAWQNIYSPAYHSVFSFSYYMLWLLIKQLTIWGHVPPTNNLLKKENKKSYKKGAQTKCTYLYMKRTRRSSILIFHKVACSRWRNVLLLILAKYLMCILFSSTSAFSFGSCPVFWPNLQQMSVNYSHLILICLNEMKTNWVLALNIHKLIRVIDILARCLIEGKKLQHNFET